MRLEGSGHRASMVRDGAEPVIGPRFARTRWRLLTMRSWSKGASAPCPPLGSDARDGGHACTSTRPATELVVALPVLRAGDQNDWAPVHESIAGPLIYPRHEECLVRASSDIETAKALGLRACSLANLFKLSAAQSSASSCTHLGLRRDLVSDGDEVNGSDPVASFSSSCVD